MASSGAIALAVATLALSLAGAAHAQGAPLPPLVLKPYDQEGGPPARDPAKAKPRLSSPYAGANALRAAGLARTSVERRFADEGAVGSVGFLCGLQPSHDFSGGASAYGVDPHGRFLGARFSRVF